MPEHKQRVGKRRFVCDWSGSVLSTESTLHQLSPYIGKIKSSIAASLVSQFTQQEDLIYDPFSGSGTVALEAWAAGRRVVANDLSPYAHLLTKAKLFPCRNLEDALKQIHRVGREAASDHNHIDLRTVPAWVRRFFHPKTLREILAWVAVLEGHRYWFLLASLLGILHHQRPGFLSFPSSHTVPYLRLKKFPPTRFPELYHYRSVQERLEAKIVRAFRRMPELDFHIERSCFRRNAAQLSPPEPADAIITSPPYMRLLDYARDNRLRLWFLGVHEWRALDNIVSPGEDTFLSLMERCFIRWKTVLKPKAFCVLIIGEEFCRAAKGHRVAKAHLSDVVAKIAIEQVRGYELVCTYTEPIPNERRVRRGIIGSSSESVVVLRNNRAH